MYIIELALKFSPFPLTVQRKKLDDALALYKQVKQCMDKGHPKLIELTCETLEDKKLAVLVSELLAVQIYEKTASGVGAKRPGFSFDN